MSLILCLGSNFFGQLGFGNENRPTNKRHEPAVFAKGSHGNFLPSEVLDIQCGSSFTIVLLTNGSIYICGSLNGTIMPTPSRIDIQYPIKCVMLACGRKHILALMEGGYCVSWGTGHFGQLGHGDDSSWDSPKMIRALEPRSIGSKIISIACGGCHSGAITENGNMFMWGLNKNGQCGVLGSPECLLEPRLVEFSDYGIVNPLKIVCGRNHSTMLTTTGRLYAWGSTSYGRLGIPTDSRKFIPTPTEVMFFHNIPLFTIASGDFHMIALTHDHSVYSWGYGADGQLGHGNLQHSKIPRRIDYFDASLQVINVFCGAWWSTALSKNGCLYAWGFAEGGWIGLPKPNSRLPYLENDSTNGGSTKISDSSYACQTFDSSFNVLKPQRVRSLSRFIINKLRCGGAHNIIFCSPRSDVDIADSSLMEESPSGKIMLDDLSNFSPGELSAHLFVWSRQQKLRELEYALNNGVNANQRDSLGNTPLIVACQNGHFSVAALLLKHGADVNAKNNTGNTALHYSFAFGFDELGQYLIGKGADEFAVNEDGMTCYEGLNREDMDVSPYI